jgi:RNA polymerase sigma factor (sigma-70 family)
MSKERYVLVDGEKIIVTEEVYRAYYRPVWREAKQRQVRTKTECSLDAVKGNCNAPCHASVEDAVLHKLLVDKLYSALAELPAEERAILRALYLHGKTEREIASKLGISPSTVHKRKNKILAKLKNLLKF